MFSKMPGVSRNCILWVVGALLLIGYFDVTTGMHFLTFRCNVVVLIMYTVQKCLVYFFSDASHGIAMDGLTVKQVKTQNPSGTSSQLVITKGLQTLAHKPYEGKGALSRKKRNILFPSGVKLCAQETFEQAIENHLEYFHLRGM